MYEHVLLSVINWLFKYHKILDEYILRVIYFFYNCGVKIRRVLNQTYDLLNYNGSMDFFYGLSYFIFAIPFALIYDITDLANKPSIFSDTIRIYLEKKDIIDEKLVKKISKKDKVIFENSRTNKYFYTLIMIWNRYNHEHFYLCDFNSNIDNLPDNINYLILNDSFNTEINKLPKSLKYLELGNNFDNNINSYPDGIEHLVFGKEDMRGIFSNLKILPNSLKTLEIYSCKFNKKIDSLPSNLENLVIGKIFNQPVDYLPGSLEILILGTNFQYPLDNLPSKLKKLVLNSIHYKENLNNLPESLLHLEIREKITSVIERFPPKLECLILNIHQKNYDKYSFNNLPDTIKYLTINTIKPLEKIPKDIRLIQLPHNYPYKEDIDKIKCVKFYFHSFRFLIDKYI